jgi:hypothetical protein
MIIRIKHYIRYSKGEAYKIMEANNIYGHRLAIDQVKTSDSEVCADCDRNGSGWVHLRVRQTCEQTHYQALSFHLTSGYLLWPARRTLVAVLPG